MRLTNEDRTFLADLVTHHKTQLADALAGAAEIRDLDAIMQYSRDLSVAETIHRKLTTTTAKAA